MITDKLLYMRKKTGIVKMIIIINVIVFIIVNIAMAIAQMSGNSTESVIQFVAIPTSFTTALSKPWTFITHMFLHLGFWHILGNMLLFYIMGKYLQMILTDKQILYSYILGGLFGVSLIFVFFSNDAMFSLGASAAVLSIVMATATLMPNYYINLFLLGPVKIKWIALFMFVTSTLLDFSNNTGGKIAHIGGAIFGIIYAMHLQKKYNLSSPVFLRSGEQISHSTTQKYKPSIDDIDRSLRVDKNKKIDEILDKISKKGYDSLSKDEKQKLVDLSKK